MERNDGFPCSCRTRDPCRAVVFALDQYALRGMEKNGPFFPRIVEGPLQLFRIIAQPEPALDIWMLKRFCCNTWQFRVRRDRSYLDRPPYINTWPDLGMVP